MFKISFKETNKQKKASSIASPASPWFLGVYRKKKKTQTQSTAYLQPQPSNTAWVHFKLWYCIIYFTIYIMTYYCCNLYIGSWWPGLFIHIHMQLSDLIRNTCTFMQLSCQPITYQRCNASKSCRYRSRGSGSGSNQSIRIRENVTSVTDRGLAWLFAPDGQVWVFQKW